MKPLFAKKPKKQKPVVIENYRASYLDKRSKTYHRVVMTAFAGLFGFAGLVYVFSSSAATGESSGQQNTTTTVLVLAALSVVFIALVAIYAVVRRKK